MSREISKEKQYTTEKIVHISFSDSTGGAAKAAYRLHEAMLEYGLDSEMLVYEKNKDDIQIHHIYKEGVFSYFYKLFFLLIGDRCFVPVKNRGHYSFFSKSSCFKDKRKIMNADIIYLHWINKGLISFYDLKRMLKRGKKIIWVMHDMFPITGGCHHAFDCDKYSTDCKECPMFRTNTRFANRQLLGKMKLSKYDTIFWISPSKWLYENAVKSCAIDNHRLYCIPNIMSERFYPLDKSFAKRALGLSDSKRYILFGADGVQDNPYKGFDFFTDVVRKIRNNENFSTDGIELLVFGRASKNYLANKLLLPVNYLGVIHDESTMNLVYNASDIFVMTSVAENYPLTVQESIACGTRVIAFNVGGISDLIDCDEKGTLIKQFDVSQMAESIISSMDRGDCMSIGNIDVARERELVVLSHLRVIRS